MSKPKTRIAIILDRSSSMGALAEVAVHGFNQQVKSILETSKDQDVRVSLVTFSSTVDAPQYWNESVERMKALEPKEYQPYGNTALYDAVGSTIEKLSKLPEASDQDTAFLVVVISDGDENYSRTYTSQALASLIGVLQNGKRWTFTYVGANQDLSKVSEKLNIPLGNTVSFAATMDGYSVMQSTHNTATAHYLRSRSAGVTASSSFYTPQSSAAPVPSLDDEKLAKADDDAQAKMSANK